jgi:hypothetical protein
MRQGLLKAILAALPLLAVGCVTHPSSSPAGGTLASIGYRVGPCHGTCPVYDVMIRSDGVTTFHGEKYTAEQGERIRGNPIDVFDDVRERLSPWRPSPESASHALDCGPRATDLQHYTIIWIDRNGSRTTREHYAGCFSEEAKALTATLKDLPALMSIEQWIQPER